MNKIDINKQYRYRNGEKARVLCVDGNDPKYPVVTMAPNGDLYEHISNGKLHDDGEFGHDLIEINPMEELLEEAKRRGYKKGVRLRYPIGGEEVIEGDLFISDISGNVCFNGSEFICWIYDKQMDRWAEIVEQPKEEEEYHLHTVVRMAHAGKIDDFQWTENKQEQLDFVKAKANKLESELLELRELINRIEK